MTVGGVQAVLQNLLREQVPILDLATILETLADNAQQVKDPAVLTELVRQNLARTICSRHIGPDGKLHAVCFDPAIEQRLMQAFASKEGGMPLEPAFTRALLENVSKAITTAYGRGLDPVVLTPAAIRRHVRSLIGPTFHGVSVVSYNEVLPGVDVEVVATVTMSQKEQQAAG